ncbi:hypothetical protein Golomagni_03115 [Golovinomyces magnicellulatus]|nr:hypothetical protein Golomagni_03115 [Golovinomyces magnicellulatus]
MEFNFGVDSDNDQSPTAHSTSGSNHIHGDFDDFISSSFLSSYKDELYGLDTLKMMQNKAFVHSISKLPTTEIYTNGHRE